MNQLPSSKLQMSSMAFIEQTIDTPQYTYDQHIQWLLSRKDQLSAFNGMDTFPIASLIGYEGPEPLLIDLFRMDRRTLEHECPVVHDVYRFVLAMLLILPPEISPIKKFVTETIPTLQGREDPHVINQLFLERVIPEDSIVCDLVSHFMYAYCYYGIAFLTNGNILFADITQMGKDIVKMKSAFYAMCPATIQFGESRQILFPCYPCTVNTGTILTKEEAVMAKENAEYNRFMQESALHGEGMNATIFIPVTLSPALNFPMLQTFYETCTSTYPELGDQQLMVFSPPVILEQAQLTENIKNGKLHMWEQQTTPINDSFATTPLFSMQ